MGPLEVVELDIGHFLVLHEILLLGQESLVLEGLEAVLHLLIGELMVPEPIADVVFVLVLLAHARFEILLHPLQDLSQLLHPLIDILDACFRHPGVGFLVLQYLEFLVHCHHHLFVLDFLLVLHLPRCPLLLL